MNIKQIPEFPEGPREKISRWEISLEVDRAKQLA